MSTATLSQAPEAEAANTPNKGLVGMLCLITAETAIFVIFVVAYIFYIGKSASGPQPREVLELPILNSICLLSSSVTIGLALAALKRDAHGVFTFWWTLTIALGGYFLFGTALEWKHLIYEKGLSIQTNLFGTTFYSLVGLHAFHVVIGLLMLSVVLVLALFGAVRKEHHGRAEILALYWHFVDVVWIVVFTVVYVIGR